MTNALLVAAIDFGTTYSGWAFSFRHEFESDPTKVSAKQWTGGSLVSSKGPTCVLIEPDGRTLDSFGYDAESKYADLTEDGEHEQWFYFKRFKMMLHGQLEGVHRNAKLKDVTEKELPAKTVFSLCIRYLKDDMLLMSRQRLADGGLADDEIHWVLTVPAIWNDAAKQFMREAAEDAGIQGKHLTIALEPEAASLYCRHLPVEKHSGNQKSSLAQFQTDTKYLVLDCGGGTVDITVHEVTAGGQLKELHKASGGAWGGTRVDDAFYQFLVRIVGGPVMKRFMTKNMEDYIDLMRDFEVKKREVSPKKDGKMTIRVPISLSEVFHDVTDETLSDALSQSSYSGKVGLAGDKLRMDMSIAQGFFKESVDSVIEHVGNLLRLPVVSGCAAIVMVGGFSESPMLQENVRSTFPGVRTIVPNEAGLAVLKGAVIFGHRPAIISERISKYTYGVACTSSYVAGRHPPGKMYIDDDGDEMVDDVFSVHVHIGQKLKIDDVQNEQTYNVYSDDQDGMTIEFYASVKPDPLFINETDCQRIGRMQVDVPGTGKDRAVLVSLKFGRTEIETSAKVEHTDQVTKAKIDFLG